MTTAPMSQPVLSVRDLKTSFFTQRGEVQAVRGVSFDVYPGEILGIVGESGSGKSITCMSVLRLLKASGRIMGGSATFDGDDLMTLTEADLRDIRGNRIGMIFQDPMTSLNPTLTVGEQVIETILRHRKASRAEARARAVELFELVRIPSAAERLKAYPHEFSGGMRQRVMIAIALACDPKLLIADEPTTALDVTIQRQILGLLRDLQARLGMAVILITHDLGVIAEVTDRIVVMYGGLVMETGPVRDLFATPMHPYTQGLLASVPDLRDDTHNRLTPIPGSPPDMAHPPSGCPFTPRCPHAMRQCAAELPPIFGEGQGARCWLHHPDASKDRGGRMTAVGAANATQHLPLDGGGREGVESGTQDSPLVSVRDLHKHFTIGGSLFGRKPTLRAVDGVSLDIIRGETLGLVGESGCGKSTLARTLIRLYQPTSGSITFDGIDVASASERDLTPFRRRVQMIFQDPYASLNGRMTVRDLIAEPLEIARIGTNASRTSKVHDLLARVGLHADHANRFAHEFSGGQRQRIGIARAIALEPDLVICDEPISALDVSVQAQVVNMLEDLQDQLGLTYLFITHDLSMVRHISDRIGVMYLGRIVELASNTELYRRPSHPYTQALLASIPVPDPTATRPVDPVRGEIPSPMHIPSGCRFRTRCPLATELCASTEPELRDLGGGHLAACHYATTEMAA